MQALKECYISYSNTYLSWLSITLKTLAWIQFLLAQWKRTWHFYTCWQAMCVEILTHTLKFATCTNPATPPPLHVKNTKLNRLSLALDNRPYALTSRLHNNDAMLGVKTCRAARTCFAGRAHWRSPSQSVCAPGPARRWGMQGFALWVHAWRWCTWRASFDPQHHGGALLWRHMHMVYCNR